MAILSRREGLNFETPLKSDSAPLNALVTAILAASSNIHALRDPTRGGVATALNEIARHSNVGVVVLEEALPISRPVLSAAELLGLDPLYVANEGKCLVVASDEDAGKVLQAMKKDKYGKNSRIIGELTSDNPGKVLLRTRVGGTRIISMLTGEQLPRIC